MKKLKLTDFKILLILLLACSIRSNAQITDTARNVRRDTVPYKQNNNQQYLPQYYSKLERDKDSITENRLVELALQQPKFDEAQAQRKTIDYQLEKERKAWLNLLSISANYNDQTFAGKRTNQTAYVYPRYFFGVTIPLGLIFSGGSDYKITKESATIVKDQELELQQTIKANVLGDYAQYRTYDKLIAIQNQSNDDAQAYYLQVEQKFSDGTATLEAYNDASAKYNEGVVKTVNLKLQQDLIKLDLEKLIGRKLEDIFK
ncbi:MAG TPA: TolC family protein [Parafilimonas sp.]|nr:TolC family protein [Parafilimonas sp.]